MHALKIIPGLFLLLFQAAVFAEGRAVEGYAPATVDMELKRVSERRGTLQHDRLTTYDTELQESAPHRW